MARVDSLLHRPEHRGDARGVLGRFHRDDAEIVRGVLHDLCQTALVFRTGSGHSTLYRSANQEDWNRMGPAASAGQDEFLWVLIYREGPLSREALAQQTRRQDLEAALQRLLESGRVSAVTRGAETEYCSSEFFVPPSFETPGAKTPTRAPRPLRELSPRLGRLSSRHLPASPLTRQHRWRHPRRPRRSEQHLRPRHGSADRAGCRRPGGAVRRA